MIDDFLRRETSIFYFDFVKPPHKGALRLSSATSQGC